MLTNIAWGMEEMSNAGAECEFFAPGVRWLLGRAQAFWFWTAVWLSGEQEQRVE